MAQTNAANHVSVNLRGRTRQYITWKLGQNAYMHSLAKPKLKSWASLVLWASTTDKTTADLLPRYTSLQMPPAAVIYEVEALITTVKGGIGPLPVDDNNLKKQADKYLPWMYHLLMEYEAADAADAAEQKHPRTFAILPQIGNRLSFIHISNLGLQR